jgi:hypothetical protein
MLRTSSTTDARDSLPLCRRLFRSLFECLRRRNRIFGFQSYGLVTRHIPVGSPLPRRSTSHDPRQSRPGRIAAGCVHTTPHRIAHHDTCCMHTAHTHTHVIISIFQSATFISSFHADIQYIHRYIHTVGPSIFDVTSVQRCR